MILQFGILLSVCWCVSSKDIPSYVHLCNRNDPKVAQCFVNTVNEIMPQLIKGIPEMDVPPIDPLKFSTIKVETGNGGAVNMEVQLINGTAAGLQNLEIRNHVMDFDTVTFSAILYLPRINLEAQYNIKGKILLFELNGGGHASFNASDVTTDGTWSGSYFIKKDKRHVRIDSITFNNVNLNNLSIRLDGLFKDDELTETVNKAINDNINSLKGELEPLIKETLSELIRDYFNRVYKLFPFDQLYPNN